jgi:diguanylate cyclase (GGDEF)-like protein
MFQKDIISILIVEDEPNSRSIMGRLAQRHSNNVYFACNGVEGFEAYQKYHPDILITDIKMPIMDGLEMVQRIEDSALKKPIVILATAYSEAEYFMKAIELKVDHLLIKPIEADVLDEKIERSITVLQASSENKRLKAMLEMQTKKLDTIFDFQNNIVFLLNENEILNVNIAFLEFFGINSLDEFKKSYSGIHEFFIPYEGFFSAECSEDFAQAILHSKEKGLLVKIFDKKKDSDRIFVVKGASYPDENRTLIISLTDISEIENNKKLLQTLTATDSLTKVYNKFKFDDILSVEISRSRRYKTPLSVLKLDIDQFNGGYNADYFDKCDMILVELSGLIKTLIRTNDSFARISFDKFAIIMPNTNLNSGFVLAEKIRESVAKHDFSIPNKITISIGLAQYAPNERDDDLFERVKIALQNAKDKGGNQTFKD